MLKQFKRCSFRSKSLPRGIPLLVHKFINTRVRYVRRNAIKTYASGPLETPTTIARRKSCEGDEFGYFRSSKEWMQLVKIDNPQHRNQNLARIVFLRLKHGNSPSQSKRVLSLKSASKTKQICSVYYQLLNQKQQFNKLILLTNQRRLICLFCHLPRLKCILNYSPSISQLPSINLFFQKDAQKLEPIGYYVTLKGNNITNFQLCESKEVQKSIMNIYGISNTMHLIKY